MVWQDSVKGMQTCIDKICKFLLQQMLNLKKKSITPIIFHLSYIQIKRLWSWLNICPPPSKNFGIFKIHIAKLCLKYDWDHPTTHVEKYPSDPEGPGKIFWILTWFLMPYIHVHFFIVKDHSSNVIILIMRLMRIFLITIYCLID